MAHPSDIAPFPWGDIVIVAVLILLNGAFAMSELAIVSARKARLRAMGRRGSHGAQAALLLSESPGKFLSTVQIGITLIAVGVGAFSGASLDKPVTVRLAALGVPLHTAEWLGFAIVVTLLTFVTLILGELVPKQLALRAPETIASAVARPMVQVARVTAPLVWLLDLTCAALFRLIGLRRESERHVTAEELHIIFAEARESGVIEEDERALMSGVVRLADRPVREIMTPRTEVSWIDIDAEPEAIHDALLNAKYARILVTRGSIDEVIGVLQSHDVMIELLKGAAVNIGALVREAPIIPDQIDTMDALATLLRAPVPVALVHDEYGHFEGIVTPADLLAAIVGTHATDPVGDEPPPIVEDGDRVQFAGWAPVDALGERLGIPLPDDRDYATVAGFVLAQLKRLPEPGDCFDEKGWTFEVTQLHERRIEQVIARRTPA